jgi:enamine deaminase RidA (YjgF/YER057c/UK114 family)
VEGPVGETPHRLVDPSDLAPPIGFSHAVVGAPGTTVFLAGQAGHDSEGRIVSEDLVAQFEVACGNVVRALRGVGSPPEHLVAMHIYVVDAAEYRARASEVGAAYRTHFGKHYPAMALLEVSALFDAAAKVELVCTAVIPESPPPTS